MQKITQIEESSKCAYSNIISETGVSYSSLWLLLQDRTCLLINSGDSSNVMYNVHVTLTVDNGSEPVNTKHNANP